MKVRLAPAAEADLAHIRDTILSENPGGGGARSALHRSSRRASQILSAYRKARIGDRNAGKAGKVASLRHRLHSRRWRACHSARLSRRTRPALKLFTPEPSHLGERHRSRYLSPHG